MDRGNGGAPNQPTRLAHCIQIFVYIQVLCTAGWQWLLTTPVQPLAPILFFCIPFWVSMEQNLVLFCTLEFTMLACGVRAVYWYRSLNQDHVLTALNATASVIALIHICRCDDAKKIMLQFGDGATDVATVPFVACNFSFISFIMTNLMWDPFVYLNGIATFLTLLIAIVPYRYWYEKPEYSFYTLVHACVSSWMVLLLNNTSGTWAVAMWNARNRTHLKILTTFVSLILFTLPLFGFGLESSSIVFLSFVGTFWDCCVWTVYAVNRSEWEDALVNAYGACMHATYLYQVSYWNPMLNMLAMSGTQVLLAYLCIIFLTYPVGGPRDSAIFSVGRYTTLLLNVAPTLASLYLAWSQEELVSLDPWLAVIGGLSSLLSYAEEPHLRKVYELHIVCNIQIVICSLISIPF